MNMMWVFAVLVIFLCSLIKNTPLFLKCSSAYGICFVINKFSFTVLEIESLLYKFTTIMKSTTTLSTTVEL
jgi:hypothetical protein